MKMLHAVVHLHLDELTEEIAVKTKELRGAIGNQYPNEILLHQHQENGQVVYQYPVVQYKLIRESCLIVGIEDGAKLISKLDIVGKTISLSSGKCRIIKKDVSLQKVSFGLSDEFSSYCLLAPWLALNEKNYDKYQRLGSWAKKRELLEKILIGNIISMSKGLGYTVPEPIRANIINLKEVPTSLKGTPMLGFLGIFSINFEIPDYWGIGKSVSRGFGTVKRVNSL